MDRKELIIIGAGPAGITAGIYAARKKMDFLILAENMGGQVVWSYDIENYVGYQFITGPDLIAKFKAHLDTFNIELKEREKVIDVQRANDFIQVTSEKGRYFSKTVIIASGRTQKSLGIEGEEKYRNKGVAFCATCDGPLFADKAVAIVGGGNSGFYATLEMMKYAKKIYVIESTAEVNADRIMVEKAEVSEKVAIYTKTAVIKIFGDKFVKGITILREGREEDIEVEGVFIEVGSTPNSDFTKDVAKNSMGEIYVDCGCRTNIPGIFAAGDVTDVYAKQIIVACGEGAKAVIAASEYLNRTKEA